MFTEPFTPEDLYWIGYFRADGCIWKHKTKNHVLGQFSQAARHPVQELANYIGRPGLVRSYTRTTNLGSGENHRIATACLGRFMASVGAKTTLRPDIYWSRHFWRGLLDGDGSVGLTGLVSGRQQPHLVWYGTLTDMVALEAYLEANCQISGKIGAHGSIFRLAFGGNKAKYLVDHLYLEAYSANQVKSKNAQIIADMPWSTHPNSWKQP